MAESTGAVTPAQAGRRLAFGARRGVYLEVSELAADERRPLGDRELGHFETLDTIYRCLCGLLYNYVPTSGHPGGSISSGRFVTGLLYDAMDYDVSSPDRRDADLVSYAAGHKALGLYALWALRNEICRIGAPELLPEEPRAQLRLEDLLGFRQNPIRNTPLFAQYGAKALDGHPTPATPFLRLSTGASGVGVASSLGLAFAAADVYGADAPRVHIVEGEGGLTPGRVAEALAAAGTAGLSNALLHVDWNQASIDSDRVCRDGADPGEYVQWDPMELAYLNDWNVVFVPDGTDFQSVLAAQRQAVKLANGQPTAVVYRTTKGWKYGIEGKASHGAGHKLCADAFFRAVGPLLALAKEPLPRCESDAQRCEGGKSAAVIEECFFRALLVVRKALEGEQGVVETFAKRLTEARARLDRRSRKPRPGAPRVEAVFEAAAKPGNEIPRELELRPGSTTTLRAELGRTLNFYNRRSAGAIFSAAADLLGSTSVNLVADGFPAGYYHATRNPEARVLSLGGICEDAMAGIFSGMAAYGHHIGVASSYGAFLAPLGHIAARLHAIGGQARRSVWNDPYRPFFLVCAHAGLKTGEDGPTHADPQALQLLQENFPRGTLVSLTPWDPAEIWTLVAEALRQRPAVIAPFVTRPNETVCDREKLGLAPASAASTGVYRLLSANGKADAELVIQESAVAYAFVEETLPLLRDKGVNLNVYYVASAELFDLLPAGKREEIFPERAAREAMGITGFTFATMHRWVTSARGRAATLHPFRNGHFLGSGAGDKVLKEAGLDGESQFRAIREFASRRT